MISRKGQLSTNRIDRDYPHQVALPSDRLRGADYVTARLFADQLSLAPLGHAFFRNDQYFTVWCFGERADAEAFREKFGGEIIAPNDRPQWPG